MEDLCSRYANLLSNFSSIPQNITSYYNLTNMSTFSSLCSPVHSPRVVPYSTLIIVVIYGLISAIGLMGNSLVIYVIIRYTKMKTVTNMYIVNLSLADGLFLLGLPMVMFTAIMGQWVLGMAMCKLYYILTCINMFTSSFTLTIMAGDRYLAACYPITSIQYRTPKYALMGIIVIWVVSFIVMMPVVLYAKTVQHPFIPGAESCVIDWPASHAQTGKKIFLTYTLLLGFVIPIALITILYSLLIIHLSTSRGVQVRSAQRRRSHKKVTKLVTLIIAVYIIFWLPYWAFQIDLIVSDSQSLQMWKFNMFKVFTLLSYANSMVNPLMYAFTNVTFREAFIGAFKCASDNMIGGGRRGSDIPSAMANNNSVRIPVEPKIQKQTMGAFLDPNDCEVTMLTGTASGNSLNVGTQTDGLIKHEKTEDL